MCAPAHTTMTRQFPVRGGGTQGQQGEILHKESKTDNQNHAVRDPDPTLFKQEKTGHILFSKFII